MRASSAVAALALAALVAGSMAQDPAEGWMGYIKGTSPSGGRLTYIEAKWKVPSDPVNGGAFFSPWFGIESSDNLNLIQPVNPWSGGGWSIYNEYFQWQPMNNENSAAHDVQAGDVLFGSVRFDEEKQTYTMSHSDLNDGWTVNTTIPVQQDDEGNYKQFTIAYFVMEKSQWDCSQYPPDNKVTFYDIVVEYEGKAVQPKWETAYVDDHCNCRGHVVAEDQLTITWESDMNASNSTSLSAKRAAASSVPGALSSGVSSLRGAASVKAE